MGINRFECRTCPYEQPIVRQTIFETTEMKQKEVEDVFGGKEEFANADSVGSTLRNIPLSLVYIADRTFGLGLRLDPSWGWKLITISSLLQHNALPRTATETVHTSSSCRSAVQMSR